MTYTNLTFSEETPIEIKKSIISYNAKKKQEKAAKRKAKEADARRNVDSKWERLSSSRRYNRAAARVNCRKVTNAIKDEVLDGIFLELDEHNNEKSSSVKKRILRRIVEKRQAQAIHKSISRKGRYATHLNQECVTHCMDAIHRQQFCAA